MIFGENPFFMKPFNAALFFFLFVTAVWLRRSLQLLKSIEYMPQVALRPFPGALAELVSVIVPMKNEARNARSCLELLKAQDYPALEIIIANDNSTDGTEQILKETGVRYVNVPPTPEGWTGKNFAIHTAAAGARGKWLLFTDADTRHEILSVSSALHHAKSRQLQLLTLLPRCLAQGFFENLIQPAAMAFIGLWFPIQKINDPDSPLFFGNGQYILIERGLYEKIGGHAAVRGEFLEDFAIMKQAKELRARAECALGKEVYGTRMYDSLAAIWRGWRRIYLHAFQSRPSLLFLRALSVSFFSIAPLLAALFTLAFSKNPVLLVSACLVQFLILAICWKGYQMIEARKEFALLHPFAALFISLILLDGAWIAATKQKTVWR